MLDQFPETVRLVVKPLPAADQQISWFAASAALAAHAQGYFWDFRDLLFQNEGALTATDLRDIAEEIGLDLPRYHRDLTSSAIQGLLVAGIAEADALGVTGTPTITINQKRLEDVHFDALRNAVEQATPTPPSPQ